MGDVQQLWRSTCPCRADCEGPLYSWSNDATKVIWRDQPEGRPGRARVRDIESRADELLLEHPTYAITAPRLSPDDRWIVFQTVITQTQRQIFVAPLSGWRAAPESTWIPISNGGTPDRNAAWSPDGGLLYIPLRARRISLYLGAAA